MRSKATNFLEKMKAVKGLYRYLLFMLSVLIKQTVRYLPRDFALWLGRAGGNVCFVLLQRERRRTLRHLYIALGDNRDNYRIAKAVFQNLGMNLFEWFQMERLNKKEIDSLIKISGQERIDGLLKKGKGVVMITSHFGNWEYIPVYFALKGYRGAVVARKIYYPRYNKLLLRMRRSFGIETLWRNGSVRNLLSVLKNNEILGILPDQDTNKVEGIFVDFFGRPAYTPTGPVNLALVSGAGVLPCFILREGKGHHIYVEEPIDLIEKENKEETVKFNTQRWSLVFEGYIKRYPEHWVWMHRRWDTKIKNEK